MVIDGAHFDQLTKRLSRRGVMQGLGAAVVGGTLAALGSGRDRHRRQVREMQAHTRRVRDLPEGQVPQEERQEVVQGRQDQAEGGRNGL